MRRFVVAHAQADDPDFLRSALLWVIKPPRKKDGAVQVIGAGFQTLRRAWRTKAELDDLQVADLPPRRIPTGVISWYARADAPDWVEGLATPTTATSLRRAIMP